MGYCLYPSFRHKKIGLPDLIFCGKESIDGDTGQVGAELAEILELKDLEDDDINNYGYLGSPTKVKNMFVPQITRMGENQMKIGIFLEIKNNCILNVGLELIGKTIDMMANRDYSIHGIILTNKKDNLSTGNLDKIEKYLDQVFIYEYEDEYLTTENYKEALCEYIEREEPKILLLGATPLGRSFGPRVAAYFKTGITADCTQIEYDEEYGLIQIRPAFGEEILAEIVTPKTFPQMATVRPSIMNPPNKLGEKNPKKTINKKRLLERKLTIIERHENKEEIELAKAKIVVVVGNAIKEKEDILLIERLAKVLGGQFGVTRPLVEGGIASYSRQVGVSGTILSASIVLLLGVSGSNQTLAGMGKAKKIIAVNRDPNANIFKKVDIGIVEDWKSFTLNILNKKETIGNG